MSRQRYDDDELEARLRSLVRNAQPEVPERLLVFLRGLPETHPGRADRTRVWSPPRAGALLSLAAMLVIAVVAGLVMRQSGPAGPTASGSPSPITTPSPSPAGSPGGTPTVLQGFTMPPIPVGQWSGLRWQRLQDGSPLASVASVVHWAGGYVALGYAVPTGDLGRTPAWTSTDGQHWTPIGPNVFGPSALILGMVGHGSGLVAVTAESAPDQACPDPLPWTPCWAATSPTTSWTSTDGTTWTAHPGPQLALGPNAVGIATLRLASGATGLVAATSSGPGGPTLGWAISADGVSWSEMPVGGALGGFTLADLQGTTAGFVAVGWTGAGGADAKASPAAVWSADGQAWTRVTMPLPVGLTAALPAAGGGGGGVIGAVVLAGTGPPGVVATSLVVGPAGLIAEGRTQSVPGSALWWRSIDGRGWTLIDGYPPLGAWSGPGEGAGLGPDGRLLSDGARMVAFRDGARIAGWASVDGQAWASLALQGTLGHGEWQTEAATVRLLPGGLLVSYQASTWYGQAIGP